DSESPCDVLQEMAVYLCQVRPWGSSVELLDKATELAKAGGSRIVLANHIPMVLSPAGIRYSRLANGLCVAAADLDGYGQPSCAPGRLDLIAIAPVSTCVLCVIE